MALMQGTSLTLLWLQHIIIIGWCYVPFPCCTCINVHSISTYFLRKKKKSKELMNYSYFLFIQGMRGLKPQTST